MMIHRSLGKLSDENLNEFTTCLNKPEIRELVTEYGDMDHPSILLQKLVKTGNSLKIMKFMGIALKTLF